MSPTAILIFVLTLAATSGPMPAARTQETAPGGFSHQAWGRVLARHVDSRGAVDYTGLARDPAELARYLDAVRRHSPDSHPELFPEPDDALAYWLNAYNAHVFDGVLERGPETESVWSGGLISGREFFVKRKIVGGGTTMNLKRLEDDVVRARFADPRVHAALNCASRGCPRLPQEPFTGPTLQSQLDAAMREFVNDERHVSVDDASGTVRLSKIFDWFADDFLDYERQRGNTDAVVLDYINRFRSVPDQVPRDYRIGFLHYDKGINAQ